MNVQVIITIGANDEGIADTPAEIAQKILDALGGDPEKDMATVAINASGTVGSLPAPPPLPG